MNPSLEHTLNAVLADPLAEARAKPGAVAYVGADFPLDIVLATERAFCHLPWRSGRATPVADQWLESAFPGWARSMLEDWAGGVFDCFASVVFSRGDDASQRLYYYICELQRQHRLAGPRALILDAATIPRDSSVRHNLRALTTLLDELQIDTRDLLQGVTAANARRQWYRQLASRHGLPGELRERMARATLFRDLYPDCAEASLPDGNTGRGVLLVGSAPPDERLHAAVTAAGWNLRGEVHPYALARHGAPIEASSGEAVMQVLAQRLNRQPYGPRTFADRATLLEAELDASGAEAVLLWLTEEDESMVWELPALRAVVQRRALPALVMQRRRWDMEDGVPVEVQRFLEYLA